jgi:diacylglycerol kinase (ATP)
LIWVAAVTLSVGLVLALELVNSALERLIDHLHPGAAPEIAAVKDIAAGAVLLASAAAVVVGLLMILSSLG